jgi:biotin operon repressor
MKAAAKVVEDTVISGVMQNVEAALTEAYETHCMMYGDTDDITDENADEWHSAVDDAVDEALQPWAGVLSADWLGQKTVDTRLDEQGAVEALAKSAAMEVYKQLCSKRKPGQILAAVGVVKSDVEAALGALQEQGIDAAAVRQGAVDALKFLIENAELIGDIPDVMEVYDELDLMSDTDEGLAASAAARTELSVDQAHALRLFREAVGAEGLDLLAEMYVELTANRFAYSDGEPIEAFDNAVAAAAPKPKAKRKSAAKKAAEENGDALDPKVLELMKTYASVKDKDVAEKLGISRASFNNKVNGKGDPITDPEQKAVIREILFEHATKLTEAIHLLDGTPVPEQ